MLKYTIITSLHNTNQEFCKEVVVVIFSNCTERAPSCIEASFYAVDVEVVSSPSRMLSLL